MTKSPERRVAAESDHGQNYRERSERHLQFSPNLSIPAPKVVVTIRAQVSPPRPHLQKRPRSLANQQQPQPKRRTQSHPRLDQNLRVHGHSRVQNTSFGQMAVHAQLSNIVGRVLFELLTIVDGPRTRWRRQQDNRGVRAWVRVSSCSHPIDGAHNQAPNELRQRVCENSRNIGSRQTDEVNHEYRTERN